MGTYGREHNIILSDEIELLRDQVRRDIFDGAENATEILLRSTSATMDQFTEELTYSTSGVLIPMSGMIGRIAQDDVLLAGAGKVRVGDVSVIYHYNVISGTLLNNDIQQIKLLTPALSGLYNVVGMHAETMANQPIYIKFALNLDDSGTS